ncbi:MAG TPA: amidohydrolase [Flavobacterium sp.]|jgi:predicted amidohydrolase
MKIKLIQTDIIWEEPLRNRDILLDKIMATESADLIVLPEMFTTGFSMNPGKLAEPMGGETTLWLQHLAAETNAAIVGSIIIADNGKFFNRLLFVYPSGEIKTYDKRHLFTLAGEHHVYVPGTQKLILEYRRWKICPLICYDLRFPVFSRNVEDYDLAIYVANWPSPRVNAWDALLKARAIENMAYVIGVNRTGSDNNGLSYPGHSQVIDPLGNETVVMTGQEDVFVVEIDKEMLETTRTKLGFLNDRDNFTVG